jgi:hypothetical protein
MIITQDVIYVLKTQYQLANPRVPRLTPQHSMRKMPAYTLKSSQTHKDISLLKEELVRTGLS